MRARRFKPAKLAGCLYNTGTASQLVSSGLNFNLLGLLASVFFITGSSIIARWGEHKWAMQVAHALFTLGTTCLYLAGIADVRTLAIYACGHLGALALSFAERKKAYKSAIVNRAIKNRAMLAGALSLVSRLPFLQKTFVEVIAVQTLGNVTIFIAVVIWAIADIVFMLAKTEKPAAVN